MKNGHDLFVDQLEAVEACLRLLNLLPDPVSDTTDEARMKLGTYRLPGMLHWQECWIMGDYPDGRLVCRETRRELAGVFLVPRDMVRVRVAELFLRPQNTPRPRLK